MSRNLAGVLVLLGCARSAPIVEPPPLEAPALPADAQPNSRASANSDDLAPELVRAAVANDAAKIHVLLEGGVRVDAPDATRLTALGYAAGGCSVDAVRALLAGGADPNWCRPEKVAGSCAATTEGAGAVPHGDYPLALAQRTALQRGDKHLPDTLDCAEVVRLLTPLTHPDQLRPIR